VGCEDCGMSFLNNSCLQKTNLWDNKMSVIQG
jgi:hypothetical protein